MFRKSPRKMFGRNRLLKKGFKVRRGICIEFGYYSPLLESLHEELPKELLLNIIIVSVVKELKPAKMKKEEVIAPAVEELYPVFLVMWHACQSNRNNIC